MNKEKYINVNETAKLLSTTERSVTRYIKDGKLKAVTEINERGLRHYKVNEQDVIEFKKIRKSRNISLSDGMSDKETSKIPDHFKDNTDKFIETTVVSLLNERIGELKSEVSIWKGKYEEREEEIHNYAYKLGGAQQKILELEGRTNKTDNSSDTVRQRTKSVWKNPFIYLAIIILVGCLIIFFLHLNGLLSPIR